MNAKEVATYLLCSKEKVMSLIGDGIALPKSGTVVKLAADVSDAHIDITDEQVDEYLLRFKNEDPGRHPPIGVRRDLLTEARYHCVICLEAHPLQFHHMMDWAILPHHDKEQMLAVCGSCHSKCTIGLIDYKAQLICKEKLGRRFGDPDRALKVAKDKKVIEEIFSSFPSVFVEIFLEEVKADKLWYDLPICLDGLKISVNSPMFYLHDKELWQLLKDFFDFWDAATLRASCLFHDGNARGVAYVDSTVYENDARRAYYDQVRKLFQETRDTLALIHAHINERYSDIDLEGLGRRASQDAQRRIIKIREEMKQALERHRSV